MILEQKYYFLQFFLFCLQLSFCFVIIRFFLDNALKTFVDNIFTQHIRFNLLDLFEDNFFVFVIIFIESLTVCFYTVFDHIQDFA